MTLNSVSIALAMATAQPFPQSMADRAFDPVPRPMAVEIERDKITDGVRALAVARTWNGRLTIGCDQTRYKGVRVTVSGRDWLRGENYFTRRLLLYHRFDRAPAHRRAWITDDRTAYLHPSSHVLPFLSWVILANRLTIRTRDIEDRESDLVFPIAGSREAINQVLYACGEEGLRRDLLYRELRPKPRPWFRIL